MATIDYGIDLGTTNSSIACCQHGQVRIFQSPDLMNVTPSVVYLGKNGRLLVGKKAYDAWPADPANTQAEFKRWMGFADRLAFPAAGRQLAAEELSAEVLKALLADARRATGQQLAAAVITVPAAFGALQCDATGRAAQLAGLTQAPLLQEPIAAAIAYGASARGQAQRWLIFDLGGGTLDIAIVSTRHGRLAVLEHQGNNRLGGKDMDRAIAENLLLPPLAQTFQLPARTAQPAEYERLFRNLIRLAEQAKIVLSTAESAPIDVFNIGADLSGQPIETTLTLTRAQVDRQIQPLLEQCLALVEKALRGARLAAADIDRVLLVGGPTQMPLVRAALISALGPKLDHSLDPMTVVAQGAALYASTLERTAPSPAAAAPAPATPSRAAIQLKLNHERASGTPQSPVAGRVLSGQGLTEIRIDTADGGWSSGWVPVVNGAFSLEVLLTPGAPATRFKVQGRSARGAALTLEPAEFAIAYMLPMSAAPLPHTIAVELTQPDGASAFDPVFKRHTPLPAEARKTYRAERTLRPSDFDASLPIKFWEIEVSDDPQERWWAGCVHINAAKIRRPIMAGTEIALTIKIDPSRKMTVEAFVPLLNQGFSEEVFVPDPPTARTQLQQQLDECFDRIDQVFQAVYAADREDLRERAETLQLKLEVIAEQVAEEASRGHPDPDALLAPTENLRKIRLLITQLEEQLEAEKHSSPLVIKLRAEHRWTVYVVHQNGSDADRETLDRLTAQLQRYLEAADQRGLKFVQEQLHELRAHILWEQHWYWENSLAFLKQPGRRFLNQAQAQQWLAKADAAQARGNFPALREAINEVWKLQPPEQAEAARDQALQSGLQSP